MLLQSSHSFTLPKIFTAIVESVAKCQRATCNCVIHQTYIKGFCLGYKYDRLCHL